jgi:small subunit ribosomal protein S2
MAEDKAKLDINIDTEEMARAGLHFGHRVSKIHPKMKPYLYGTKSTVHIIDLEKTKEKLIEALEFVRDLVSQNKILLLVGTKIQIKDPVKDTAKECGLFYVSERWLGGTITNFASILKRIEHYRDLEKKKAAGELEKYTKKERIKFDEELVELERKFGGIKELDRTPDALFVCDMKKDALAAKEARTKGIKVIAICDTNIDPTLIDYPIPASDDAASSVKYILDKLKEVTLKAKS